MFGFKRLLKYNKYNLTFPKKALALPSLKYYQQVKDLDEILEKAKLEEEQRTAKYLEYTHKVYQPSKTITFDRNGEVLLFSCDNFRHSQVYLKYPYIMIDCILPLAFYNLLCDPFGMSPNFRHMFFYTSFLVGWMPHHLYVRQLAKKLHKIYLMRGGKYCRVVYMNFLGEQHNSWITNKEIHFLTEDLKRFDNEKTNFLTKEGKLKYEVGVQIDNFSLYRVNHTDEVFYLMKEGTVHEPELFEMVVKGFNIDTTDCVINTEDNFRWLEPHKNN